MILHIDMDAFYASVEERDDPGLKGHPVVVGGRPEDRGVVAAANYTAREFGIHSAMPMARAVRLCRHLVIVPPRGQVYREVSGQIQDIFRQFTPLIEPLSLDEAFLDISASLRLFGDAEEIGRRIKQDIRNDLGLVASVGGAPNKFLAKLASDQGKPDGFLFIHAGQVQDFLDPLPVESIWGVGKAARSRLHAAGVRTIGDLRRTSGDWLETVFGKSGARLWQLCHGIDERAVVTDSEAKSISHETTFSRDIADLDALEPIVLSLTEGVCYRLRRAGLGARTVNLKVRFHDFSTVTRAHSLPGRTDHTLVIWRELRRLLRALLADRRFAVRLVGVGVSNFTDSESPAEGSQADLFETAEAAGGIRQPEDRQEKLDRLTDEARRRFGRNILRRGRGL